MATRISALPAVVTPVPTGVLPVDGATTQKITIQQVVDTGAPVASQAEAEAGANNVKRMTPLTTKQFLDAQVGVSVASASVGAIAASALQPGAVGTTVQAFNERLQTIAGASGSTGQVLSLQPDDTLAFTNAGAGDMITAQYDPDEIGANAFDSVNQLDFFTQSITSKAVPAPVSSFWTSGYDAPGDGGSVQMTRIAAPSPPKAWHRQSSDGAWWQFSGQEGGVDLIAFGLKGDASDETSKFLDAVAFAKALGINKVVCRDSTRRFKLIRAEITDNLIISLGGAKLVADFKGALQPNNCTNILKAPGGYASGALTFSGVGSIGTTITIGSKTYTLRASLTGANDILIGVTASATAANLAAAIMGESGSGTTYGAGTVMHPQVRANAVGSVVTITAYVEGTAGNAIVTTETGSQTAFGAGTLTGGKTPISITLVDTIVDGLNDGTATSGAGEPLVHFIGGNRIRFEGVSITNGGNRDNTTHARLLEYTNAECLIDGASLIQISGSQFRSSPGEILQIQSWDGSTILQATDNYATKTRDYNPALNYSSSSLNLFNLNPASYVKGMIFANHVKSPANIIVAGMLVENIFIDGVSDSSGLDFNEASSGGFDQIQVRNVTGRNVSAALVRASASNFRAENIRGDNCLYTVRIEGDTSGGSIGGTWIIKGARELTGVELHGVYGVGGAAAGTDSVISVVGASASLPAHVSVYGGDGQYSADPLSPLDYGINTQHCDLELVNGAHREGRAALIRMTGYARLRARGVVFDTTTTGTNATHLLLLDAAAAEDVVLDDCKNAGTLNAGASDIRFLNATTLSGQIYLTRSPTISTVSDATKPIVRSPRLRGSAASNPNSLATGQGEAGPNITVTGAALGDEVSVTFSLDLQGIMLTGWVSAANTVSTRYQNETGSTVNLGAGTVYAYVQPRV